jgi:hypothetical protein
VGVGTSQDKPDDDDETHLAGAKRLTGPPTLSDFPVA